MPKNEDLPVWDYRERALPCGRPGCGHTAKRHRNAERVIQHLDGKVRLVYSQMVCLRCDWNFPSVPPKACPKGSKYSWIVIRDTLELRLLRGLTHAQRTMHRFYGFRIPLSTIEGWVKKHNGMVKAYLKAMEHMREYHQEMAGLPVPGHQTT